MTRIYLIKKNLISRNKIAGAVEKISNVVKKKVMKKKIGFKVESPGCFRGLFYIFVTFSFTMSASVCV